MGKEEFASLSGPATHCVVDAKIQYISISVDLQSGEGSYLVAPGIDPSRMRWRHAGATGVRVDETTGDLLISPADVKAPERSSVLSELAPAP